MEKYNNIKGYPGYFVSKSGKVYSKKKSGMWILRKPGISRNSSNGLLYHITLFNHISRKRKQFHISRLVALAWVPNPKPEEYNVVCHKDNNRSNNHASNLYWGTQSMNIQQAVREGRFYQCKRFGKDNPMYGKPGPMLGKKGIDHPMYGRQGAMRGKHHTDESKQKISIGLLNKPLRKISVRKLRRIYRLRSKGWSQSRIALRVKLHQTQISKILNNQIKHLQSCQDGINP